WTTTHTGRHTAIHAARALFSQLSFVPFLRIDFVVVLDAQSRIPVGDRIATKFQKAVWMIVRHESVSTLSLQVKEHLMPPFSVQQAQEERRVHLSLQPGDARPLRHKQPG